MLVKIISLWERKLNFKYMSRCGAQNLCRLCGSVSIALVNKLSFSLIKTSSNQVGRPHDCDTCSQTPHICHNTVMH